MAIEGTREVERPNRFDVYYGVYHACLYIERIRKIQTHTTRKPSPRRMFELVTSTHDLGVPDLV